MAKVLIAYASRTKKTEKIAKVIAEKLQEKGHEVDLKNCRDISDAEMLEGYDSLILGSATYHGKMMNHMETFLFLAEKANLRGKIGGAFGSYGWSGEAPQRIHDTMSTIFGMEMPANPLKIKQSQKPEKFVGDFVEAIASKL